jgi:hypothetical protein
VSHQDTRDDDRNQGPDRADQADPAAAAHRADGDRDEDAEDPGAIRLQPYEHCRARDQRQEERRLDAWRGRAKPHDHHPRQGEDDQRRQYRETAAARRRVRMRPRVGDDHDRDDRDAQRTQPPQRRSLPGAGGLERRERRCVGGHGRSVGRRPERVIGRRVDIAGGRFHPWLEAKFDPCADAVPASRS